MTHGGSITLWLGELQDGNPAASEELWKRYFNRLTLLARQKLRGRRLGLADEEDVALSAFDSFCRGAEQGRYPDLNDRDNLWRLLVVITAHKALHLVRDQGRQKRGGDRVRMFGWAASDAGQDELQQIVGREPTPEFALQIVEECQRLLKELNSDDLERVAVWKMEGYTNQEIATKLNCAPRTVERKLRLIRAVWERPAE